MDFELIFDKDWDPSRHQLFWILDQPDAFLWLATKYGNQFQALSSQERLRLIDQLYGGRNLDKIVKIIMGTSNITPGETCLHSSLYGKWLYELTHELTEQFFYQKCLNTKQLEPFCNNHWRYNSCFFTMGKGEDIPQQIAKLIGVGINLNSVHGISIPKTPFLRLLRHIYYYMHDAIHICGFRLHYSQSFKYIMQHHRNIASELLREWLEILQNAGVDLQDYGKNEKQLLLSGKVCRTIDGKYYGKDFQMETPCLQRD